VVQVPISSVKTSRSRIDDFAPRSRPVGLHHGTEKIFGKGIQPGFEAGWQNPRPPKNSDLLDPEPRAFELPAIGVCRSEIPRVVAAHLGDKAATTLERPMDACQHCFLVTHPMQRSVREHRVELIGEG